MNSIKLIIRIIFIGVFFGDRFINIMFIWLIIEKMIMVNHKFIVMLRVNIILFEIVNIIGIRFIILINRIIILIELKNKFIVLFLFSIMFLKIDLLIQNFFNNIIMKKVNKKFVIIKFLGSKVWNMFIIIFFLYLILF